MLHNDGMASIICRSQAPEVELEATEATQEAKQIHERPSSSQAPEVELEAAEEERIVDVVLGDEVCLTRGGEDILEGSRHTDA